MIVQTIGDTSKSKLLEFFDCTHENSKKMLVNGRGCLKVRLHTAINCADFVSWSMIYIRKKVTKGIREKMTTYFRSEPLHHIRRNTKSTRLIAVAVCWHVLARNVRRVRPGHKSKMKKVCL